ncbi:MAG: peptidase S41, partial [Bacteroidales bacterium]|nr:peptidase S41 [Bacteroidales bacterium]
LKKMGARSIILDLRGNPGGLLVESVNVSNLFVNRGQEIVSTKGKIKQWDGVYKTTAVPVDTSIPLVVLVNRGSASASEIVAGAMQDLDRAVLIGQRTFGKGLVQTTRPLSYDAQLKVTTAKYYIPSGRCIQAVDYSHRNEDGSVGYIPDSLIREYETINGRKVYDGGGISPDIVLEPEAVSSITISLYTKNLIFDYATLYAAVNKAPEYPGNFSLNDQDYKSFIQFLQGKDYDYNTQIDSRLQELIEIAKQEKYYDIAVSEFTALQEKLAHDKEKDLQNFKDEIKNLLEEEIVSRYYFQKGRIQKSVQEDDEIARAIELLKNPRAYTAILQGPGPGIMTGLQ